MKAFALSLVILGLSSISTVRAETLAENDPKNQQILDSVIANLETQYNLECKPGREPGSSMLNPVMCLYEACTGTVRFKCRNSKNELEFKVRAKFTYTPRSHTPLSLKKVVIQTLND